MRRVGPLQAIALFASASLSGAAQAQSYVDQCVAQYVTNCGTVFTDPAAYVAQMPTRPNAKSTNTPDGTTLVVSDATDYDPGAYNAIWETVSVAVAGDARYITCSINCMEGAETPSASLVEWFTAAVRTHAPGATIVGGALQQSPNFGLSEFMWGSHILHVRGWTDDPAQPMLVNFYDGGIDIHSMVIQRAGQ